MDTFFVRTIMVPAFVVLVGRWTWWPSRLFRQHSSLVMTGEPTAEPAA
jgi:RND superfamily putative drug exporter